MESEQERTDPPVDWLLSRWDPASSESRLVLLQINVSEAHIQGDNSSMKMTKPSCSRDRKKHLEVVNVYILMKGMLLGFIIRS